MAVENESWEVPRNSSAKFDTSSSSEYNSVTSTITTCSCSLYDCTDGCEYGNDSPKRHLKSKARKIRKELSKICVKTSKNEENSKGKELEVSEKNKKLLENNYSSDSSDNCDKKQYNSKHKRTKLRKIKSLNRKRTTKPSESHSSSFPIEDSECDFSSSDKYHNDENEPSTSRGIP